MVRLKCFQCGKKLKDVHRANVEIYLADQLLLKALLTTCSPECGREGFKKFLVYIKQIFGITVIPKEVIDQQKQETKN